VNTPPRTSEEILRDIIADHYGVGKVDVPETMADAHQRRHRKLVVHTQMGDYLVKTYQRDPQVLDSLRFQHRLSDHLAKHGVPVATIQPARNGKRIVELDTWALELQQFVNGEPMLVTGDNLRQSSIALGRFHQVCHDFPRPPRDTRLWRFSEVPRESFRKLYELALTQGNKDRVNEACNQIALFLHASAEELGIEQRSQLETGLIHGDWHSGNLIFRDDRLVAIVDLEFAGDGSYLEDLAYATSNLCIRTTVKEDRLNKRVNILLDNYQRYRSLSFREEAALYYAVGVKHVATVAFQIQGDRQQVAGHGADEWMFRLAAQCTWLQRRAEKVRYG
jgi:Ser/Thr protein kinase RdoA (MazF antagonist)